MAIYRAQVCFADKSSCAHRRLQTLQCSAAQRLARSFGGQRNGAAGRCQRTCAGGATDFPTSAGGFILSTAGHAKHAVDLQEGGRPRDVQGWSWQNEGLPRRSCLASLLYEAYSQAKVPSLAVENWQELVQNFAEQVGMLRGRR